MFELERLILVLDPIEACPMGPSPPLQLQLPATNVSFEAVANLSGLGGTSSSSGV